jgi:drug/metabolite transporter (DMT)-like permease
MKLLFPQGPFGWGAGMLWGASNMLFTSAIQLTAVANVLVIVASNTVFSSIFSYLLLGELIPIRMIVTSLICFGAIALIFSGEYADASSFTGTYDNLEWQM